MRIKILFTEAGLTFAAQFAVVPMMEGLNSNSENAAIELELKPEPGSGNLNITVSHGPNQHQVVVPANSTFGMLFFFFSFFNSLHEIVIRDYLIVAW